ncbi:hypothetical protein IJ22_19020 [Paenibacillus naphthalenovorans]|uniref:Uncharacterized protein n=1 Tax=Paenibacillus naphthalenovorans TaxID=162209 RepID=A0A0U2W157_9BACL|nr:hypothetical protein IJ22_19020 [Paenibacillus naphthalenovorans]
MYKSGYLLNGKLYVKSKNGKGSIELSLAAYAHHEK